VQELPAVILITLRQDLRQAAVVIQATDGLVLMQVQEMQIQEVIQEVEIQLTEIHIIHVQDPQLEATIRLTM
jgi:hypothetical protein